MCSFKNLVAVCCCGLIFVFGVAGSGRCLDFPVPDRTFMHLYGGKFSDMNLRHVFTDPSNVGNFKDPVLVVAGGGVEYRFLNGVLGIGAELNIGLHQDTGQGLFVELAPARFVRLHPFRKLPLSLAVGDGISYTTSRPRYEEEYGGDEEEGAERLLNFLFLEVGLGVGERWEIFARMHHRSSIFGTVGSDENSGSNFPCLGVRWGF